MADDAKRPVAAIDDQQWAAISNAIWQLETSWHADSPIEISDLVPSAADPLRQRVLVELIKVDQEHRWKAGERKLLESYLDEWPGVSDKPELVAALLEGECETRAFADTVPTAEEITSRFPEVGRWIELEVIEADTAREGGRLRERADRAADAASPAAGTANTSPDVPQGRPLEPGHQFGRYQIRELLGQGGMGTVYRAYDTQLEREVALKIPQFDPASDPDAIHRFVREGKAAAKIEHPNICTVYDAGEIEDIYYISMRLARGPSLASLIKNGPVHPAQAAVIGRKIAMALTTVHAEGIIHRDLKPTNVMMDESGEPLLMDFGLARTHDGANCQSSSGVLLGTVPYVSSEQLNGEAVDARSDIYSLGVMLYEMLTGRLPYAGKLTDLMIEITKGRPAKPRSLRRGLPLGLQGICLKAMARYPADRYKTAEQLANTLGRYLEGTPQDAGPVLLASRLTWLAAAGALLVVVAAIVILTETGKGMFRLLVDSPSETVSNDREKIPGKSAVHGLPLTKPSVHGSVWNDINGNGIWDRATEQGLKGWSVYLDDNRNGFWDAGERFETTNADGQYSFERLSSETNMVAELLSDGWEQTFPSSVVYETDFSTDPAWVTANRSRYLWDSTARVYKVTQVNINNGGEYAYWDGDYDGGSFILEWDIRILSMDYASAVSFGLYDMDLNALDRGSFAMVRFSSDDQGTRVSLVYKNSEDIGDGTSSSFKFLSDNWYHVIMVYDSRESMLTARIAERNAHHAATELTIADVGNFAPEMKRVGTSNVRKGEFQRPGAESSAEFDNVRFSVSGLRCHRVKLTSGQIRRGVDFGNRKLAQIHGVKWNDMDGNGVHDEGEPGLEGRTVYLDENLNGQWDPAERSEKTDDDGCYSFAGLPVGVFLVAEQPDEGWVQTFPPAYEWNRYRGHLYAMTRRNGTWLECECEAVAAGGHLVSVNDAAENAWLTQAFASEPEATNSTIQEGRCRWIGLQGLPEDLSWVSGEPLAFVAPIYLGRWRTARDRNAYLFVGMEARAGMWWNSGGNDVPETSRPRGIIELPCEEAGPVGHRITLVAGQVETKVDFGSKVLSDQER